MAKTVRTRFAEYEHEGESKDISGSGAAIKLSTGLKTGDEVEVDTEDIVPSMDLYLEHSWMSCSPSHSISTNWSKTIWSTN